MKTCMLCEQGTYWVCTPCKKSIKVKVQPLRKCRLCQLPLPQDKYFRHEKCYTLMVQGREQWVTGASYKANYRKRVKDGQV